jgi:predicted ATPase/DNA-binding SARP family transcriptional activator
MGLDVRLAGGLALEAGGVPVDTGGLGRLGRVALAYLVVERSRPVTRDELAEVLWGEDLPRSWETAARVVISKVRAVLARAGLSPTEALTTQHGRYLLNLGPAVSVDVEWAADQAASAMADLGAGRPETALAAAAAAAGVAARQFLPGAAGPWVEFRQAELRQLHLQALDTLAAAASAGGDTARAIQAAEEVLALEPLREPAWVRLMAVHAAAGSQAEALRVYERCRRVLAEELGVGPSPATDAAYAALLGTEQEASTAPPPERPSPAGRTEPVPLPLRLTSFVGREGEVEDLTARLATSRLVTLAGPGGVGKSRLALETARAAGDAVWVELGPLADARLLETTVLTALGAAEAPDQSPLATLVATLADRRVLLVLDNCEHLLTECAAFAERVLSRCAEIRVLATSRESLRIPAETVYAVGPLPEVAGVRLMVERATSAAPHFEATPENLKAAAQVCRDLDGIPLALELAAARARTMSLADIAKHLDDRFTLLSRGARTAPARHRTLRAAIDWSYETLTEPERTVFDRLSVFAGSFTPEAADHVCSEPGLDVAENLTRLVETSLVELEARSGPARYRLLQTMRRYGQANLATSPEATRVRARLLAWVTELATGAESTLEGDREPASLDRLDAEYDNVRAAIAWGASPASPAGASLAAAAALGRFWDVRGRFGEGRLLLDAALADDPRSDPAARAGADPRSDRAARARALNWSGILAQRQGDYAGAGRRYRESLALMDELGDRAGMAAALLGLGNVCALQGDSGARLFFEESLAIGRELDDRTTIAASLTNLGWLAHHRGDFGAARELDEESLARRRELGDRHGMAVVLGNLGFLAFQQGDYGPARALDEESLRLREELGDRHGVAMTLLNLGHLALQEGDDDQARTLFEQSLAVRRELGDRHGEAGSLAALAELARLEGDHTGAARLLDEALSIARQLGDRYRAAGLLVRVGRLAGTTGDRARAEVLLREALTAAGDLPPKAMIAEWLEGLGASAAATGDAERAARLLGAAEALRRDIGAPVAPRDVRYRDDAAASARAALGEKAYASAWAAGCALGLDEAIALGARRSGHRSGRPDDHFGAQNDRGGDERS